MQCSAVDSTAQQAARGGGARSRRRPTQTQRRTELAHPIPGSAFRVLRSAARVPPGPRPCASTPACVCGLCALPGPSDSARDRSWAALRRTHSDAVRQHPRGRWSPHPGAHTAHAHHPWLLRWRAATARGGPHCGGVHWLLLVSGAPFYGCGLPRLQRMLLAKRPGSAPSVSRPGQARRPASPSSPGLGPHDAPAVRPRTVTRDP